MLTSADNESLGVAQENECPDKILHQIRIRNVNRVLIGHLNINSLRNKFEVFKDIIKDKLDIIMVSETKLDDSFPS